MNEKRGVDLFVDITTYQMMNPRPLDPKQDWKCEMSQKM